MTESKIERSCLCFQVLCFVLFSYLFVSSKTSLSLSIVVTREVSRHIHIIHYIRQPVICCYTFYEERNNDRNVKIVFTMRSVVLEQNIMFLLLFLQRRMNKLKGEIPFNLVMCVHLYTVHCHHMNGLRHLKLSLWVGDSSGCRFVL